VGKFGSTRAFRAFPKVPHPSSCALQATEDTLPRRGGMSFETRQLFLVLPGRVQPPLMLVAWAQMIADWGVRGAGGLKEYCSI